MRLRNKKTGKVQTCDMVVITDEQIDGEIASLGRHTFIFRSIEQFNDQYEGYKPVEPLIKDEKIRKAVRAWAEANGVRRAYIIDLGLLRDESTGNEIKFNGEPFVGWVTALKAITELCGEEK